MSKTYNFKVTLREVKGDPNRLIKKFIKKTKRSGLLEELKNRSFYEKPSEKRRKKKSKKKKLIQKAK